MSTNNKVCLITGASKGIGRATAVKLAAKGYCLVLMARDEMAMEELAGQLPLDKECILILKTDLRDQRSVEDSVQKAIDTFGRIDVLINNAGLGYFRPADEIIAAEWDEIMTVNVKSGFLLSKAVLKGMKKAGSGHIIAVASDVSKRVFPGGSAYCASKYAQDAFFAALRKEVRASGVKVSCVYPGLVNTPFHSANPNPEASQWLAAEDVADAIDYIVSAPAHVVIDELMIHPMCQEY